ncbi:MAG: DUF1800 domain-containing protein [Rhodocyclaceae bacterium]
MTTWRSLPGLLAILAALGAQAQTLGTEDARHLLARTGFGASPGEIAQLAPLTREEAVDRLLRGARRAALTPLPAEVLEYVAPRSIRSLGEPEREAFARRQARIGARLRAWWVGEMLASPSPLTERMTLFWHNHFVSSQQKVRSARLMALQNATLRAHALGSFADLLHAVAKDPAMIVYLDTAASRRGQPNENFAREVMELFTLGEGHYDERDVKEAARAFTGWSVDADTGAFRWRPLIHDDGIKTVLGRSGAFDGDAVLDILLAQPATAELVVARLWREFVSPRPDPREAARIAARFRDSGYEIKVALRELLLSAAFWARENRGVLTKSPVDLVAGTLRSLEIEIGDALPFALVLRSLGQDLFAPPGVKGWPGGEAWINTATLPGRSQFLDRLLRAAGPGRGACPTPQAAAAQADADEPMRVRMRLGLDCLDFDANAWMARTERLGLSARLVMLAGAPAGPIDEAGDAAARLRALVLDPMYQLR